MPYGPNRWGVHPKSTAIKAGGIGMFYRHPFLAGHVNSTTRIDEIDVSRACKLNETFLDAQPAMDSAYQEVLVDGSVIHITNTLLAGTLSLQVLEQGGFVGRGDFITALHLVLSTGDDLGGTFTVVRSFNGTPRVRVYYGVFAKNVPHERVAGNAVIPYSVQLSYAGWFDGIGKAEAVKKYIWAVGNQRGIAGFYDIFKVNTAEVATDIEGQTDTTGFEYDYSHGVGKVDNKGNKATKHDDFAEVPDWPTEDSPMDNAMVTTALDGYNNIRDSEVIIPPS